MQIVILAAGRGTRMRDLTESVPKPMLEINGKPILAYKLEALPREIDEVIFVIGYLGNQIQKYFGNYFAGRKISYVAQEQLNGTGGAVMLVKDFVKNDFVVMMGDDLYLREDIEKNMKNDLSIVALEMENPKLFGTISLNENGDLDKIVEKSDTPGIVFVNTGLYKLNKKFFDYALVSIGNGEYGLPQALAVMAKDFSVKVEKSMGWFPIGNPDDLKKAESEISKFN